MKQKRVALIVKGVMILYHKLRGLLDSQNEKLFSQNIYITDLSEM